MDAVQGDLVVPQRVGHDVAPPTSCWMPSISTTTPPASQLDVEVVAPVAAPGERPARSGSGIPRRRHSRAKSGSPSDRTPPSRSVTTVCSSIRRRSRWTIEQRPPDRSAVVRRLLDGHRREQGRLLVRTAHSAARTAATSGRESVAPQTGRGRRAPASRLADVDPRRPHLTCTPRGTETRMTSALRQCWSPPATSADAPASSRAVAALERRPPTGCPHLGTRTRVDRRHSEAMRRARRRAA